MKEKIDPFMMFMAIISVSILSTVCYMSALEREDKNKRTELIKEAIENNWTPEQIKVLIEARK